MHGCHNIQVYSKLLVVTQPSLSLCRPRVSPPRAQQPSTAQGVTESRTERKRWRPRQQACTSVSINLNSSGCPFTTVLYSLFKRAVVAYTHLQHKRISARKSRLPCLDTWLANTKLGVLLKLIAHTTCTGAVQSCWLGDILWFTHCPSGSQHGRQLGQHTVSRLVTHFTTTSSEWLAAATGAQRVPSPPSARRPACACAATRHCAVGSRASWRRLDSTAGCGYRTYVSKCCEVVHGRKCDPVLVCCCNALLSLRCAAAHAPDLGATYTSASSAATCV